MAFPGASQRVSGEIEKEFSKYSVRMLQSSVNSVIELASAITSIDSSNNNGNNNNAYYEISSAWKRVLSYRNRVMGVFYHVLAYIYEEPDVSSRVNSANGNNGQQTNSFGNNRLSGDVGNLSGITVRFVFFHYVVVVAHQIMKMSF